MPFGDESNHQFNGLTVRGGFGIANQSGGLATVDYDRFAAVVRGAVCMRGQGFYAETFPRNAAAGTTIGVSGSIYFGAVGLLAGDIVSNISVHVQTLASGFSGNGVKLGLYSKTGGLLASSADAQAAFGSTGMKTTPMTTPYTVLSDDLYYAAILSIATTPPVLLRGGGGGIALGGYLPVGSSAYGGFGVDTAETDLNATQTIVFNVTTVLAYWMGIS